MSWNHRILAHENNGEIYFQLHEVYYTNEVPDGYTANPITVGSESIKGIKWTLNKMQEAIKKPVLWAGEKHPQSKLTEKDVLYVLNSKESPTKLAKEFNVTYRTIANIKSRKTWKHLD